MNFCFYEEGGGITSVLTASSQDIADLQGGDYLACSNEVSDVTHYVSGGKVLERSRYGFEVHASGLVVTIEGLPPGVVVYTESKNIVADSEPTEIEFDSPGTYSITLYGIPQYLDETLEVTLG